MKMIQNKFWLLLVFIVSLTQAQPNKQALVITHLTGDFYIYTTSKTFADEPPVSIPANGMYLVTRDGVVLFDTPFDTTQFQPLLDSILHRHHKEVKVCFATHSHNDRTSGLEYYRRVGIKTYTTIQTDEISKTRHEKRAEYLMKEDTTFTIGQYTFQTYYPGPGHAPDNIVIWFPKQKILYGGCIIKSNEAHDLGNLADANVNIWEKSIKKLMTKFPNPVYVIPGHFGGINKKSLRHTLELIREYKLEEG